MDVSEEDCISDLLLYIDNTIQYGEDLDVKIPRVSQSKGHGCTMTNPPSLELEFSPSTECAYIVSQISFACRMMNMKIHDYALQFITVIILYSIHAAVIIMVVLATINVLGRFGGVGMLKGTIAAKPVMPDESQHGSSDFGIGRHQVIACEHVGGREVLMGS